MALTFKKLMGFQPKDLTDVLATKNKNAILAFLDEWGLHIADKMIKPKPECINIWTDISGYWDKQQLVKKIALNSAWTFAPLTSDGYRKSV